MCQINRTFDKYIDILNTAGRVLIIGKHDKKDKPRAPERDSGHNEDKRVQKHLTSKSFKYTLYRELVINDNKQPKTHSPSLIPPTLFVTFLI